MILVDHEYHVVELHTFKIPPAEMFEWLQLKFGPGDGYRWMYKHPKIYFADPKDHMMFLLRWS
jgi:hypothetical protein